MERYRENQRTIKKPIKPIEEHSHLLIVCNLCQQSVDVCKQALGVEYCVPNSSGNCQTREKNLRYYLQFLDKNMFSVL